MRILPPYAAALCFLMAVSQTGAAAQGGAGRPGAPNTLAVEIVPSVIAARFKPAFTPDGRYMAVGGGNGATLWDIEKRRLVRTFTGLKSHNTAVAISPDGTRIAAGAGNVLNIWNVASGAVETSFDLRLYSVSSIAFSKDGLRLIYSGAPNSSSGSPSMFIREIATGRVVKSHVGRGYADSVDISADGRLIAVGDGSGKIYLYDIDGRVQKILPGHTTSDGYYPVSALAFSPDGRTLASLGRERALKLWDVVTGRLIRAIPGHAGTLHSASVSWSPDGTAIATTDDESLRIWETSTGLLRRAKKFQVGDGTFAASHARYTPDGRSLIVDTWGLQQVDSETLNPIGGFGAPNLVSIVQQSGNSGNAIMVFSSHPRQLLSLDVITGALQEIFRDPDAKSAWLNLSPSKDGKRIAARNWENSATGESTSLTFLDVPIGAARTIRAGAKGTHNIDLSPDGQIVAATGEKLISLIDTKSGNIIRSLAGNSYSSHKIKFTADGKSLVTSWTGDQQIRVFSLPSGHSSVPVKFTNISGELVTSPDSASFLVLGTSFDHYTIEHWSVSGPRLIRRMSLPGQDSLVTIGDFHPDSRLAVLGGFDGMLRIWDLASGSVVRTLRGHTGPIDRVLYAAGGRRIVSAANDGLKVWDATTGELLVSYLIESQDEWLAITPEGFFEASASGAKMLSIVRGLEVYSIDQFYNQLHRPDLVKQKLAGDPEGKVRTAAARLDLNKAMASGSSPSIKITSPAAPASIAAEQVTVQANIADEGGGIGKIEWRLNGTTVGVQAAPVGGGKIASIQETLWLLPGENKIEVVAYNAQGLIASEPASVMIQSTLQPIATVPRLHVLAVGVNEYWDSALRLSFAVPDATAIAEGFRRAGEKLYERVEATTVLDADATAGNLDRVFSELSRKVRPQDVFVFFMSGHGKTVDGRFYFIPHDFRYAGESSIVNRGIGQDQLQGWFARIKAQKSILLFDACESGALIGERIAMRGMEEKTAIDLLTRAMGRTVLTATTDDKPAAEGYRGHGVFTYSLLSALGGADGNGDDIIDVLELANFVDREVPALTFEAWKMRQVPQMKIVGSNFPLVTRTMLQPATQESGVVAILPTPTHVMIAPAAVRQSADATAAEVLQLQAGMQVRLIETVSGWALIARGGKKLGYVEANALVTLQ